MRVDGGLVGHVHLGGVGADLLGERLQRGPVAAGEVHRRALAREGPATALADRAAAP